MFNDLDENKLREQYNKTIEEDLPDMNLIWADIESRLDSEESSEKSEITVTEATPEPKKSKSPVFVIIRNVALCAACAAAVFGVAKFAFSPSMNSSYTAASSTADGAVAENAAPNYAENAAETPEQAEQETNSITAEGGIDEGVSYPIYYENLPLAKSDGKEIVLTSIPETNGYFVEDGVLEKTELFMYATVADVTVAADGTKAAYSLTDCIAADGTAQTETENIIIESASPFIMKTNRRYLLALSRSTDGSFKLAFEEAPQIEVTLDGGLVFHNGWQSLCESSDELIYPKEKNNEYFYDRMRYSASGNTDVLFAKWKTLRS